jgi:ribosomal protein S18 acetylase RimI-like enzyme
VLERASLSYFLKMGWLAAALAALDSACLASIPGFGFPELDQLHQPARAIVPVVYIAVLGTVMGIGAWACVPRALGIGAADYQLRLLGPGDVAEYQRLKQDGLKLHPDLFELSADEFRQVSPDDLARELAPTDETFVLGAFFDSGALVGLVEIHRTKVQKLRHRASLKGMLVAEHARGRGIGRSLLVEAISRARAMGIVAIGLVVSAHDVAALTLYETMGFVQYGRESHSLKVGDSYAEGIYMQLLL